MVNGAWLPVCGRDFWDNNYGASLFCQKLDSKYTYGLIIKTHLHYLQSQEISNTEFQALLENGVVLSVLKGACFGKRQAHL